MATILIVDDDASIRETLQASLERLGHRVTAAEDGLEALQRFDQGTFDLIVSDVMMPEMNGFDLLQNLQSRILDRVPFIILSSHDDREGIKAALFAGAFDYILKPFDEGRIREVLERALQQRAVWSGMEAPSARQAPVPFRAPSDGSLFATSAATPPVQGTNVLQRTTKVVTVSSPPSRTAQRASKGPGRWFKRLLAGREARD